MYATFYCVYAIYKVISVLYKQSGGYKKMHKFDYKKRTTCVHNEFFWHCPLKRCNIHVHILVLRMRGTIYLKLAI